MTHIRLQYKAAGHKIKVRVSAGDSIPEAKFVGWLSMEKQHFVDLTAVLWEGVEKKQNGITMSMQELP